mgnify:CR=1 FL=1|tara:strand:+ start:430 stop:591 length:162 start_codon:yes stop_codon:yes gene_type:complete
MIGNNPPRIHINGEKIENDDNGFAYNKLPSDFDIFDEEDDCSDSDGGSQKANK